MPIALFFVVKVYEGFNEELWISNVFSSLPAFLSHFFTRTGSWPQWRHDPDRWMTKGRVGNMERKLKKQWSYRWACDSVAKISPKIFFCRVLFVLDKHSSVLVWYHKPARCKRIKFIPKLSLDNWFLTQRNSTLEKKECDHLRDVAFSVVPHA